MNDQSMLFRTISEDELRESSRRYLKEELISAELLDGGLFNTTYRLKTEHHTAILRLGPVHTGLLLPYEHHLMEAEKITQELLHKHRIPTSELIALDTGRTFLDRDIMVVECIPGVSLSTISVSKETDFLLCQKAGEYTRQIHEITADELPFVTEKPFGRLGAILAGEGGKSWSEAILKELSLWRPFAEKLALFSRTDLDRFEALYHGFAELFDEGCSVPRLVHADLWAGNLLVKDDTLLALIDCDRALFGDPEFEFATGWMTGPAFCAGYGREADPAADAALRRRLYKLLLNLEDCYVHIGEYSNPEAGYALCAEVSEELAALEQLQKERRK